MIPRARKTACWLVAVLLFMGGMTACGDGSTDTPTPTEAPPVATQSAPTPTEAPPVATQSTPTPTEVPPAATQPTPTPTEVPPAATQPTPTPTEVPPAATQPTPTPTEMTSDTTQPIPAIAAANLTYAIVDTGQILFYDNEGAITVPVADDPLYGQDGAYNGFQPSYVDNDDGTVTDLVTGLMWQRDLGNKLTYAQAVARAESSGLAGYDDWRLPTLKELYSLILFSGTDPSGCERTKSCDAIPFIDTNYFVFEYGAESEGERMIDSQYVSATRYVGTTMRGDETVFGVNFADGRIKGYPVRLHGQDKAFYVRYVRGNPEYGINDLFDNGNGTVTDRATALMWTKSDSGVGLNWGDALGYCSALDTVGSNSWRLPNVKELQSIVDYTRSPGTTGSAATSSIFDVSLITDEADGKNYPAYWSSTTHVNLINGRNAAYIAFGEALGWMRDPVGRYALLDVHGAGAQRSDPKVGDPGDWPNGRGPQGDVIRIFNYVRCVNDA